MRSIVFALAATALSDCARASTLLAPQTYPATLAVAWDCVDADAQADLVRGIERTERDAALRVIEAEKNEGLAKAQLQKAQIDAESNKAWSLIGKFGVVGIAIGAVVGGVLAIANAFGSQK